MYVCMYTLKAIGPTTLTYLEDRMQDLLELRRAEAVHALQQSGLQCDLRVRIYMQGMLPGSSG